jgi:hypothetical protein
VDPKLFVMGPDSTFLRILDPDLLDVQKLPVSNPSLCPKYLRLLQ